MSQNDLCDFLISNAPHCNFTVLNTPMLLNDFLKDRMFDVVQMHYIERNSTRIDIQHFYGSFSWTCDNLVQLDGNPCNKNMYVHAYGYWYDENVSRGIDIIVSQF